MMKKLKVLIIAALIFAFSASGSMGSFAAIPPFSESPDTVESNAGSGNPLVVIDSYSVENGSVLGGQEFTLKLVLKNVRPDRANDVLVSMSAEGDSLYPVTGKSNQVYAGSIAGTSTIEVFFDLHVAASVITHIINLNFNISYTNQNGTYLTNNSAVVLILDQESGLQINNVSVPTMAAVGSKMLVNISFKNSGQVDILDLELRIEGDIQPQQKTLNLGTFWAGNNNNLDYYVTFLSPGEQTLSIYFIFEDTYGNMLETAPVVRTVSVYTPPESVPESTGGDRGLFGIEFSQQIQILATVILIIALLIISLIQRRR